MACRWRIGTTRELLLVEIERRCAECNARVRPGLTKEEASSYRGFECERCERWNDDDLSERDIPEWWEELKITGLAGLREQGNCEAYEPSEVVKRINDACRQEQRGCYPKEVES